MADETAEPLPPKWQVLATTTLLHDRWLRLDRERVRTSDGHVIDGWYLAHSLPWTCAVATVPDGRVVTIEQYRRGPDARQSSRSPRAISSRARPLPRRRCANSARRAVTWPTPPLSPWVAGGPSLRNTASAQGFAVTVSAEPGPQALDAGEAVRVGLRTAAEVEEAIVSGRFCHAAQIGFWYAARARGLA